MAEIGHDIYKAGHILKAGDLVAIPTETVYGLAGNAFDEDAVTRIFTTKDRPSFDPLIVHISDKSELSKLASEVPEMADALMTAFWPGPLTILLRKKDVVPDLVTSGLDTVAVRVPEHPLAKELLATLDFPLAAPSANPFGYVSPTSAAHVNQQLGDRLKYILDGGDCRVGIESTIISFEGEVPVVLRLGGLSVEDIEEVIGSVEVASHSSSKPMAPGMLKSHYAPKKTIILLDDLHIKSINDFSQFGALMFDSFADHILRENQILMSADGDLNEAAKKLFSGLRALDQRTDIHTIVTQFVPDLGLGRAINDRIKRAIAKS